MPLDLDSDRDPLGGLALKDPGGFGASSPRPRTVKVLPDSPVPVGTPPKPNAENISFFLDTIEQAGVPENTPIAFLNDPERQVNYF